MRSATLSLGLLVLAAGAARAQSTLEEQLARAAGLHLVRVTAVREVDERPDDGPWWELIEVESVRGSGAMRTPLRVTLDVGGRLPPERRPAPPKGPLAKGCMQVGQRCWVLFASTYDAEAHPQQVIAFWPEAKAPRELDAAARADRFAGSPQFDPATGVSVADLGEKLVARRGEDVAWERQVGEPRAAGGPAALMSTEGALKEVLGGPFGVGDGPWRERYLPFLRERGVPLGRCVKVPLEKGAVYLDLETGVVVARARAIVDREGRVAAEVLDGGRVRLLDAHGGVVWDSAGK